MIASRVYIRIALLLITSACTSQVPLTQANIDKAELACKDQLEANRQAHTGGLLEKFMKCRTEKVMPFELRMYRSKAKIRDMYAELEILAARYDRHEIPLKQVYDTWDQRKIDIGMNQSILCVNTLDGGQTCATNQGFAVPPENIYPLH
jgi:hypothetical protein